MEFAAHFFVYLSILFTLVYANSRDSEQERQIEELKQKIEMLSAEKEDGKGR